MHILFVAPFLCGLVAATQHGGGQQGAEQDTCSCNGALSIDFQCAGIDAKLNEIISSIAEPEWNLVFKAVAGIAPVGSTDPLLHDPFSVWLRDAPLNEDNPAARQLDNTFQGHFKSSFALNWARRNIQEVKVALFDASGSELMSMTFDGAGSDSVNWFTRDRLLSCPYNDIFTESQIFFSVLGDDTYTRRWFINNNYGGCSADAGWLVTVGKSPPACNWEKPNNPQPTFLYSTKSEFTNWNLAEAEPVYVGCFGDTGGDRAVPDSTIVQLGQTMTNEWCIGRCLRLSTEYRYAVTQNGPTCRCGLNEVPYDKFGEYATECTSDCRGSGVLNGNKCGGPYRNTVWDLSNLRKAVYVGCFGDTGGDRAVPDSTRVQPGETMTNEWCIDRCLRLSTEYRYAVTQNGQTCRCGLNGVPYDKFGEYAAECTNDCRGSGILNDNKCGGPYRNTVWDLSNFRDVGEASVFGIFVKSKNRYY